MDSPKTPFGQCLNRNGVFVSFGWLSYQAVPSRIFYGAGTGADCPVSEMLNKVTSTMVDGGGAAGEQVSTEGVDGFENKLKMQVRKVEFF